MDFLAILWRWLFGAKAPKIPSTVVLVIKQGKRGRWRWGGLGGRRNNRGGSGEWVRHVAGSPDVRWPGIQQATCVQVGIG